MASTGVLKAQELDVLYLLTFSPLIVLVVAVASMYIVRLIKHRRQ
jgi:hypothetical protein